MLLLYIVYIVRVPVATQTEVLSLQQMCIDVVAKTFCSPKDVQLLPLPDSVKEKIAKVVFDPDVDFCYFYKNDRKHYGNIATCNRRSSDPDVDTTIDRAACKSLMTALR